jgi:macrolide transport system ATP-binding/permease protein
VGDVRPILLVLLGGAALLLVITSVNVANLLLVRGESRRREMAVRSVLGGSRARLFSQFATESTVLVVAGSVPGLAFAYWVMQLLTKLIPEDMKEGMPFLQGVGLNWHVVLAAALLALLAAVLFSITPVLRLPVAELRQELAEGSRASAPVTWRRLGSNLVVLELAIAVVLLVGSGLLGKSLYHLLRVELGFQPDHLATLYMAAPESRYSKDDVMVALGRQIIRRLSSLPGVKSAAIASLPPVSFNGNTDWIRFVGRPYSGEHNEVNERDVSSAYFTTLRAKLLRGRFFTDAEDESKPRVVIINQALARKYFPGEDPIGKKIGDTNLSPKSIKEIIGIVDDIKEGALDSDIWPAEYHPFNQDPGSDYSLVIRTSQSPESMLLTVDRTIRKIDPSIGTVNEASMTQRIHDSPAAYLHRSSAWLVGGFAALALLLSVVGLYGVVAYAVSQRTREIGVRMALGAQSSTVYQLILNEAARLAVTGIVTGLLGSLAAATLIRKLLFDTQPWDILTLATVAVVLTVSALLASYLPAHRAASINPVEALRAE